MLLPIPSILSSKARFSVAQCNTRLSYVGLHLLRVLLPPLRAIGGSIFPPLPHAALAVSRRRIVSLEQRARALEATASRSRQQREAQEAALNQALAAIQRCFPAVQEVRCACVWNLRLCRVHFGGLGCVLVAGGVDPGILLWYEREVIACAVVRRRRNRGGFFADNAPCTPTRAEAPKKSPRGRQKNTVFFCVTPLGVVFRGCEINPLPSLQRLRYGIVSRHWYPFEGNCFRKRRAAAAYSGGQCLLVILLLLADLSYRLIIGSGAHHSPKSRPRFTYCDTVCFCTT